MCRDMTPTRFLALCALGLVFGAALGHITLSAALETRLTIDQIEAGRAAY